MMNEFEELNISISGILNGMHSYWDLEMPDLRDYFDEVPDELMDFKDALDDAWDKFADLIGMVDTLETEE